MAIAFDAATDGGITNPGTSHTFSHTTGAGSDRILFVFSFAHTTDVVTGATYAGSAMTLIDKRLITGDRWVYLWYIVAPSTGANNVVISASSSVVIAGCSASYTGASQTGQPDSFTNGENPGQTTFSLATTTVADNCWAVMGFRSDGTDNTPGTGDNERVDSVTGFCFYDTGPVTPAGSVTISTSSSNASPYGGVIASFAPAATTAIKTFNGLANASVKTINSLARASVKTYNGLA